MRQTRLKTFRLTFCVTMLLSFIMIATLLICGITFSNEIKDTVYADTTWTGLGTGTKDDPYLITKPEELGAFRDIVNASNAEWHAVLGDDITLTGNWTPIGNSSNPFEGTFDGNGHTIGGLTYNDSSAERVGLFGHVKATSSGTEIKNVTVSGSGITADKYVGGIVGNVEGGNGFTPNYFTKIINCHNYVPITAGSESGGIAGAVDGVAYILDCSNHATIQTNTAASIKSKLGGIVGVASGSIKGGTACYVYIENCYNDGAISLTNTEYAGGIIGSAPYRVNAKYCFNYNSVSGDANSTDYSAIVGEISDSAQSPTVFYYCHYLEGVAPADAEGEAHNAAWFASKDSFTTEQTSYAKWDFTNTWEITNGKYPTFLPDMDLYIAGHRVTVGCSDSVATNRGYYYDRSENRLALGNQDGYTTIGFDINAPSWGEGIRSELDDLTIYMRYSSRINNPNKGENITRYGIYATGNLKFIDYDNGTGLAINGSGSSYISKDFYGIYCLGDIIVECGYLDINGGAAYETGESVGIYAISITLNSGTIMANGFVGSVNNTVTGKSIAIETTNGVTIKAPVKTDDSWRANWLFAYGYTDTIIGKVDTQLSGFGYSGIGNGLGNDSRRAEIRSYPYYLYEATMYDYPLEKGIYTNMANKRYNPTDDTSKYRVVVFGITPIHIDAYLEYEMHYMDPVPEPEDYKHDVIYSSNVLTEGSLYELVESKVTVSSYYEVGDFDKRYFRNENQAGYADFTVGNYDYRIIMHNYFNIDKARPDFYAPIPKTGLLYTGEAQDLIIPATIPSNPNVQSTIEYKTTYGLNSGSYNTATPQGTDVYTYYITYRVTPQDTDHYATITEDFSVRIDLCDKTALENAINTAQYYSDLLSNSGFDTSDLVDKLWTAQYYLSYAGATQENINTAISDLNAEVDASTVGLYVSLVDGITFPVTDLSDEDNIRKARALYNIMSDDQKDQIENEEEKLARLELVEEQLAQALINDIGTPSEVTSPESTEKVQKARDYYDSLSNTQKSHISNIADLEEAEDYLNADEAHDLIGEIGTVTFPDSKDAIKEARGAYDALTPKQKDLLPSTDLSTLEAAEAEYNELAAQDFIDKVGAIGTPSEVTSPGSKDAIDAAKDALDALTEAQKALVPQDYLNNLQDAVDRFEADAVKDKIDAIGEPSSVEYTNGYKTLIDAAKDALDALTEDQIALVPQDLLDALESAENYYVIDRAHDLINAIGTVVFTSESKGKIDDAKEAYDDLTEAQKALIAPEDVATLESAEATYDELAAQDFKDKVDAIGDPASVQHTNEYKELIDAAKDALNALTEAQKDLINQTYFDRLEQAEHYYDIDEVHDLIEDIGEVSFPGSKDAIKAARDAYDDLTEAQKALIAPEDVATLEAAEAAFDALAAQDLIDKIDAIGDPASVQHTDGYKELIDAAKDALDELTEAQLDLVPQDELDKLNEAINQYDVAVAKDKIDAIGDPASVQYTDGYKELIDAAKEAVEDLTQEQRNLLPQSYLDALQNAENYYEADRAHDLIDAIGTVEYTPESKEKIDAARAAYEELTDDQKALVDNDGDLLAAEEAYDQAAANYVKDLIDAIGNPEEVTSPESKDAIDAAKDALDELTEDQKGLISQDYLDALKDAEDYFEADVVNDLIKDIGDLDDIKHDNDYKEKIDAAREAYDELTDKQKDILKGEVKDLQKAEDKYEAEGVKDLIKDIDFDDVAYDEESKAKIEEAKEAYNNLTPEQKAFLEPDVLNELEEANDKYNDLLVDDITGKINNIGKVEYDEDSKEKIDEARAAYDSLSEEEKKLIPQDIKDKLDNAEKTYDQMDVDATRSKIKDKASSVVVETQGRGIPRNVELRVKVKTEVSQPETKANEKALKKAVKRTQTIAKVYDVKLIQIEDGKEKEIQPSDIKEGMKIKIHMPLPEGINTEGLSVLHIHNDGSIDVISDFEIIDGEIIIEVSSLSEFAIVEKTGHGFCVGWIVFIFMMLELLFLGLYCILKFHLLDDWMKKIKFDTLFEKMDLLTFVGMCASQMIFLFALIALCLHACAVTIVSFIFALLIMCVFEVFFLDAIEIIHLNFKTFKSKKKIEAENKKAAEEEAQAKAQQEKELKQQREYERMSKWGLEASQKIDVAEDPNGVSAVGIIQNRKGKVYLFNPNGFTVQPGDIAQITDLAGEKKAVAVVIGNHMAPQDSIVPPFKDIEAVLYAQDGTAEEKALQAQKEAEEKARQEEEERIALEQAQREAEEKAKAEAEEKARLEAEEKARAEAEERAQREAEEKAKAEAEEKARIEAEEKARREAEALSLKASFALAKATESSHTFSKTYVCEYLKTKNNVEVNARGSLTSTGLPLADTHYVVAEDKKTCFIYVYETEGSVILLAKMDDDYAKGIKANHKQVNLSAFPKQKNTWYSLIIDDSYTKEEVEKILDDLVNKTKQDLGLPVDEGISLKESIKLAKATTSSHKYTKSYVCEYLRSKENVEVNTRSNMTSTGLPLADTHYVIKGDKKTCFAYVYETEGSIILLAKMKNDYANELKKNHSQVNLSAFPKQKDTWYSLIIDDSYTKEDFERIIDDIMANA